MSNFFITLAVFLITVIGALFAVPYFIDWNGYRGVFEEEATRLLGREVRVGGSVNLHLLPTPYFRFEKVRIADTSVNLQEPLFRSESLAIKLSIPPIFRGVVEANEIELQRPVLRVALNDKDGWNWQSLGQVFSGAAYLPANVSLASVKITDGTLALHGADGAERTRFEAINGELSSPALDGPYRFRGTFGKGRAVRELRVATARAEPDSTVRFKANLRSAEAGSTYTLDGRLADPMGKPSIAGELTARLPIAGLWNAPRQGSPRPPQRSEAQTGIETKTDTGEPAFDLKAKLDAGPAGATLSELALAFEQGGRPQLVTGDVKASWRDALAVEMSLASRWLDLDRMAGLGEATAPLDSIVPLAIAMRDLLPGEGRSRAFIAIDQGNVGGDAVSNLRLALARTQDNLQIEELQLGLPGGSRAELRGVVSGLPEAPTFDGSVSLRGSSLVRFLGWASATRWRSMPRPTVRSGSARASRSRRARSPCTVFPASCRERRSGGRHTIAGGDGRSCRCWSRVRSSMRGPSSPREPASPTSSTSSCMVRRGRSGPTGGLAGGRPGWRSAQTDALIRVNAGQLLAASRTYRDVMMEIELRGGRLRVPQLKVSSDEGFSLELEGDLDDVATRPKGVLRGVIGAESAQAIQPLTELLGVPDTFRPGPSRAGTLVPLRLAGSMVLGARTPTSTDLVLDGEVAGGTVKLNARLDGGNGGWRTGPADVTALVEAADSKAVAALLAPGKSQAGGDPTPGRLLVKSSGVPAQGLASLVAVDAGDLGFRFRGRLVAAETGNSAAGEIEMRAADATRVAALAGLAPPLRLDGVPIAGSFDIKADGTTMAIDKLALTVGGGLVTGQLSLASVGDRRRVEARLDAEELSVAKLLQPLLDQRLATAAVAEAAVTGRASPWPDEPFDGGTLDAFEGSIRLKAKRLTLAEGIGLTDAGLDIALAPGKVDVSRIEGACLRGRCSATLRIDKVPAGAELSGSLRVTGAALEAIGGERRQVGEPRHGRRRDQVRRQGLQSAQCAVGRERDGHAGARRGEAHGAVAGRHCRRHRGGTQSRARQARGRSQAGAGGRARRRPAVAPGLPQARDGRRPAEHQAVRYRYGRGQRGRRSKPRPAQPRLRVGVAPQPEAAGPRREAGPAGRDGDLSRSAGGARAHRAPHCQRRAGARAGGAAHGARRGGAGAAAQAR